VTEFTLNGRTVAARAGENLIEAAARYGIEVPRLCYKQGMRADGNCRACMVEIEGERVLAPSCCRFPASGKVVTTARPPALASQRMVVELLLSEIPQ
jgi:formate dehydrogenase major subunit